MSIDRLALSLLRARREPLAAALAEAGATLHGDSLRCPWHEDSHASGRVHRDGDAWRYYCMGDCGWAGDGKSNGDVVDVVGKVRGLDLGGACAALGIGNGNGHAAGGNGATRHATAAGSATDRPERAAGQELPPDAAASEAAARLRADPAALAKLLDSRGIDGDTARRFGVGVTADGRYWTFPVTPALRKLHRVDPGTEPKCRWDPGGRGSRFLWPVALDESGPVWLTPGELKALAVAACGRAAIGVTAGEAAELPDGLVELVRSRAGAIAGDDDDTGRKWVDRALDKLRAAGIDARAVDLGLNAGAGLKDVADLIVARLQDGKTPDEIGAELDDAFERADPWRPFTLAGVLAARETWEPAVHVPSGFAALDNALGGGLRVGGVHVLAGRSGRGKTQAAVAIAVNAARAGHPVGVISLEMSRRDLAHLIVASVADVPRAWVAAGTLGPAPASRAASAIAEARRYQLTLIDSEFWDGPPTRSKIAAVVDEGARRFGWRLVVPDYAGLVAPEPGDATEYAADCANSAELKRLAARHGLALLVVADLRKGAKFTLREKLDEDVSLDDLRGAARVGYDAANVLYCTSTQAENGLCARPTGILKLVALKTRFAAAGSNREEISLRWYPSTGRICDLDKGDRQGTEGDDVGA